MDYVFLLACGLMEDFMRTQTTRADSPHALAHVLAMVMASHSKLDPRELRLLEDLDAFRRIGMSEEEFLSIASRLRRGACQPLTEHDSLHADDLALIDDILDGVRDPQHRLLLCRLAGCIIVADGCVQDLERTVYDHMLRRWGHTRASVSQAILSAHMH